MMGLLARASRRSGVRGLSDALVDAGAASSGRQLWAPAVVRSASATATDDAAVASSSGGTFEAAPGVGASASSTAAAAGDAVTSSAAGPARQPLPPGHTDFQQRQLVMLFTCSKCETRSAKAFSKQSYEQGVVIVECSGCNNKHLIADNLGWFGEKGTVEEFAAARGGTVVCRTADGTVQLSPEDLLGPSLAAAAAAAEAGGSTAAQNG